MQENKPNDDDEGPRRPRPSILDEDEDEDDGSSVDYDTFLEEYEDTVPPMLSQSQRKSSHAVSFGVLSGGSSSLGDVSGGLSSGGMDGEALSSDDSLDLGDLVFDLDRSDRVATSRPRKGKIIHILTKSLNSLDVSARSRSNHKKKHVRHPSNNSGEKLQLSTSMNNNSVGQISKSSFRSNGKYDSESDEDLSYETDGTSASLAEDEGTAANAAVHVESASRQRMRLFLATFDDWLKRKIQYVYVFGIMYAFPICVAIFLREGVVAIFYMVSIGAIVFVNAWMLVELIASFSYTARQRKLHHSRPKINGQRRLGAIVAAYLPNELTVLIDTIRAVSQTIHELPEGTTLDIVLAHNGGKKEQRITLLESLRKVEPDLPPNVMVHELNVLSSTSKAENVNAGLAFFEELGSIRGKEFTQLAMYDADHQPIPEAWRYALETMQDQKANMVMGRCCVQDGLKYIAVEFDVLYAVAHAGGRCVRGFGFFGGSNGYWDYNTLVETGMDEGMLTEDVDSSFRAQAAGNRMTYDSTIVSYEESPPDFSSLFKQRLRWSQGWFEVSFDSA